MKNKIILIASLLIFISLYTKAENREWKKGYVITNNNDTIHGLLAYRNGEEDWKNCLFKKTETDSTQLFTPSDLKEFFYNEGVRFESINLEVKSITNLYFAECLLKGSMSLYYLRIKNEELYESYYSVNSSTGRIISIEPITDCTDFYAKNKRKNLLKAIFNFNPILNKEIDKHALERDNLIDYFKKYNELICSEYTCVSYNEEKKKRKKYLSISAGSIASFESESQSKQTSSYFSAVIGAKLYLNPSKISERSFVCFGLQNFTYYINNDEKNYTVNILSLSVGSQYRYMPSKIKPDIECGIFFNMNNPIINSNESSYYCTGIYASAGINIPCKRNEIPIHIYYSQALSFDQFRSIGLTFGYRFKL